LKGIMKLTKTLSLLLILTPIALAQGLYAPEPPANSSFVRIINAALSATPVSVKLGGKPWIAALTAQGILPYEVLKAGNHSFEMQSGANKTSVTLSAKAGKFYTLAVIGASNNLSVKTFNDQKISNKVKAQLLAYNFSSTVLSIKTSDGTNVFKDLKQNASQEILVNPVNITFDAYAANQKNSSFKLRLQSTQSYSFVAFQVGDKTKVVAVNSTTTPLKK
jgi:alginate O-acetyltransferase complex protein AlgF